MEETNYCILCQEQHTTTAQCMEWFKVRDIKGHAREDCPRGLKRKHESQEKESSQVSKVARSSPLNDSDIVIIDISGSFVNSCNDDLNNANVSVQEKNMNVVHISDDDDEETKRKNNNVSTYENDSTEKTVMNEKRVVSGVKPNIELKKIEDDLEPGRYKIVSVHIELLRSSKQSSTSLTQIGCVVNDSDDSFFMSIKPSGIDEYLDCYKLSGDLLQALHMTREDDGTYLFRKQFEDVKKCNKVGCVEESEAISSLIKYLEKYPKCVLLGVDEDTVAILANKLGKIEVEKLNIIGYTYWKRVLKYLDVEDYKNVDLEDYSGEGLPGYKSALDIAKILMKSVEDITTRKKHGRKSMQRDFFKLCKRMNIIRTPKRHMREKENGNEKIEVYSSFRPTMAATFSAEKLEQIVISSDSDSEPVDSSDSESENSSSITTAWDLIPSEPEYSDESAPEPEEIEGSQEGHESVNNAETETSARGQASSWLVKTSKSQVGQASASTMINTGNRQVGQVNKITAMKNTSATYWKLAKTKQGNPGVFCPYTRCKNVVLLKNIHDHLARVHTKKDKEILSRCLLCPDCNTEVLPSVLCEHLDAGCKAPLSPKEIEGSKEGQEGVNNATVGTETEKSGGGLGSIKLVETRESQGGQAGGSTMINTENSQVGQAIKSIAMKNTSVKHWKLAKSEHGNPGVVCPWCSKTFVLLRNIHDHIARIHTKKEKEILGTSLLCPDCNTAVLTSVLCEHLDTGCVAPELQCSSNREAETEENEVGQGSVMLVEAGESQVGQASARAMINTGNSQVGQAIKSIAMNNSSAKHWKPQKSKQGNPGVACPWCCSTFVLLRNIHGHIARVHTKKEKELLGTSLLCPDCNTAVLTSVLWEHLVAGCVASVPQCSSNSSTDTLTHWKIENRNNRGYCILCPCCKVFINLKNISQHTAKFHKNEPSSRSQQCPSCDKSVLTSEVFDHITSSSCSASILNQRAGSSSQDSPININPSKSTPKPLQEASQPPPIPVQQKSKLTSSQEASKPPTICDQSESTQKSSPGVKGAPLKTSNPKCISNPPGGERVSYGDKMETQKSGAPIPIRFVQSKCHPNLSLAVTAASSKSSENWQQIAQVTADPPCVSPTAKLSPYCVPQTASAGSLCVTQPTTASSTHSPPTAAAGAQCIRPPATPPVPPCASSPATACTPFAAPPSTVWPPLPPSSTASPACAPPPASSGLPCVRPPVSAAQVDSCGPQPPASHSMFPPGLILPGMIVAEGYPSSVSRLKINLEHFILTCFRPVPGGYVHCLWMYEQYQLTMMHLDQKMVVSPVAFSTLVPQICARIWGVLLGISESRYGHNDLLFQFRFDGIMPIQ